jgi:bacillithiol biosynthesis cysteine-adding enzyme BshC
MSNDHCTLPYSSTGSFSKLAIDYVAGAPSLRPFYRHTVNEQGLLDAIEARKSFHTPRQILTEVLTEQYGPVGLNELQAAHLDALKDGNTFTIVTAHQPNIFTGPLYFIYKILHAIKLADELTAKWPQYRFVPVYYMGSEDADLEELGYIYVSGEKLTWNTGQTGAVGRMHTRGLEEIIERLRGQFGFLPYGVQMIKMLEDAYLKSANIQEATYKLVNELFASFGLLVLIPDHPKLKAAYAGVMKRDLLEQFSSKIVSGTIERLQENYKVQAGGRDINLFYLFDDGRRERIELTGDRYRVLFSDLNFSKEELLAELEANPQRFSPNVILRGMFQETILPNIAFIGGGGELAYWLELKDLFEASGVPYPMQVLRNSFLLVNEKAAKLKAKLGLTEEEIFLPQLDLENLLAERLHGNRYGTSAAAAEMKKFYQQLEEQAGAIDVTLRQHVAALHTKALKKLEGLEKKMKRAERRKLQNEAQQLETLKTLLFPNGNLQERTENFMPYFAQYGPGLLQRLYNESLTLEQEFTVSYLDAEVAL